MFALQDAKGPIKTGLGQRKRRASGTGERAARMGLNYQDRAAARLIYDALLARNILWVGLADRSAGMFDDVVLGLNDRTDAYQFKRASNPASIGLQGLLLGKDNRIAKLADAFNQLCEDSEGRPVNIHYITNEDVSTNDRLINGDVASTTASLVAEWQATRGRTLVEWRQTKWQPLLDQLFKQSGLSEATFERLWNCLRLVTGAEADLVFDPNEDETRAGQIDDVSKIIGKLVGDNPDKDRWSEVELLAALGWKNRFRTRFSHDFPLAAYVQRNELTEASFASAIEANQSGYLSLLGPPGSGKSTLLQRSIRANAAIDVVRYLAFVPSAAQGQGRAEADNFLDDLIAQLARSGLEPLRYKDQSTVGRQQSFEHMLEAAGRRHRKTGKRTIIVIDGLDHVPREERPQHSFLSMLPLPPAIPDGVLFILGSQRLDLPAIPPSVRGCAEEPGRAIYIAPLSAKAVGAMVASMSLSETVDHQVVHSATKGHPLVTRYLLNRLASSPQAQHQHILENEPQFGGDVNDVYQAAWRSMEGHALSDQIGKVFCFLAYAEGRIEPNLLAKLTSDEAVEAALGSGGHLLDRTQSGWRVFHNSFRQFLRTKPVLRFGLPDSAYEKANIYKLLAEMAGAAGSNSPQRWLEFRYRYLSGALQAAAEIASRAYFLGQYIDGRPVEAVDGDIADAFRALKARPDPEKLFDMLLCADEIRRREQILEGLTGLSDAWLEVGDLAAAENALADGYQEGEQWRVLDALLVDGQRDKAREIFEDHGIGDRHKGSTDFLTPADLQAVASWARQAVRFLEPDQIINEVTEAFERRAHDDLPVNPSGSEDKLGHFLFEVAGAHVRADPRADPSATRRLYGLDAEYEAALILVAASAAYDRKDAQLASDHLQALHTLNWAECLNQYDVFNAARIAFDLQQLGLAKRFADGLSAPSFGELEQSHRLSDAPAVARYLMQVVAIKTACGLTLPVLKAPSSHLLRGLQHHIVTIGTAIGALRRGDTPDRLDVKRIWSSAIQFLASAKRVSGEDPMVGFQIPACSEGLAGGILRLLELAKGDVTGPAKMVDELCMADATAFKWWFSFRRFIAVQTFLLDDDALQAARRLEITFAGAGGSDPPARAQEALDFARGFARVGAFDRARQLLAGLRRNAIGIWVAAKKDGVYETWASVLRLANEADPAGRPARAPAALRLLTMLAHGEGYDMASRICREVLFEVAASSPSHAWRAAINGATSKWIGWDCILDSVLRSVVCRDKTVSMAATTVWLRLCLPYYGKQHASTDNLGQFLMDAFEAIDRKESDLLEVTVVDAIKTVGRSDSRHALLKVVLRSAEAKGGGGHAKRALAELGPEKSQNEEREAEALTIQPGRSLSEAAISLQEHLDDQERAGISDPASEWHYQLRIDTENAVRAAAWDEIRALFERFPFIGRDESIAFALLTSAFNAGDHDAARSILLEVVEPVAKGWSWGSGRYRKRYHEWHRRLFPEAQDTKRGADFADDMARSKYSASAALCEVDEIFPILFEKPPWPLMWSMLVSQLEEWADFKDAVILEAVTPPETDEDLLVEVLVWAATLGIPAIGVGAAHAITGLLKAGFHRIAFKAVDRLLECGGEASLWALEVLLQNHHLRPLVDRYAYGLPGLSQHPDMAVAAGARYLAAKWGIEIQVDIKPLPAFYRLSFPDEQPVRGAGLANEKTRGLIVEDPMGWTEGFGHLTREFAETVALPEVTVRHRVADLIRRWGGVQSFGHLGSSSLEEKLGNLGLILPYGRPQVVTMMHALRQIAGDFLHARLLSADSFHHLLRLLRVHPNRPVLPEWTARPPSHHFFAPASIWGHDSQKWLDTVAEGSLVVDKPDFAGWVLAEWYSCCFRRSRTIAREGSFSWPNNAQIEAEDAIEQCLLDLPAVLWFGRPFPAYEEHELHETKCAKFELPIWHSHADPLLVICPRVATTLGWYPVAGSLDEYRDDQGQPMVRTICWRDGMAQPVEDDEETMIGQHVVLTDAGRERFEAVYGCPSAAGTIWRSIERADKSEPLKFRSVSVPRVPSLRWP